MALFDERHPKGDGISPSWNWRRINSTDAGIDTGGKLMEIRPRKRSDRGGIITMPLKRTCRIRALHHGKRQNAQNVELYVGNALFQRDSAKICLMEECVLCVH